MDLKACKRLSNLRSEEDVISQIPDDILIEILSSLSMKEAARANVVSRRWENLWKLYRGCFNFENPMTKMLLASGSLEFGVELSKYVSWVDQVLNSHQGDSIEQFRICFDLGKHDTSTIDKWIAFAAVRGVHRLELDLKSLPARNKTVNPFKDLKDIYEFPTPTKLSNLGHHYDGLKSLISLRLVSVDIAEEHVLYMLSNWPLLEELSIADAPSLHQLRVVGSGVGHAGGFLKLKHLEIRKCKRLEHLEVSTAAATSLVSFRYGGHYGFHGLPMTTNMLFQNVPKLSSVSLERGDYSLHLVATGFRELPFPVAQLHTLTLDLDIMVSQRWYRFPREEFAQLPNLCRLELVFLLLDEQSMLFVGSFLRASPSLHALVLKYQFDLVRTKMWQCVDCPELWQKVAIFGERHQQLVRGCKYNCLKEVAFLGWNGCNSEVELFTHLTEAAAGSLERVIIDPCDLRG